ncbi:MAG TPA: 30S ribosomal protein S21 [Patescibacteria group bacterium]|nr:30S ribosomal protein S21 [Patescibacteria group bacterium]
MLEVRSKNREPAEKLFRRFNRSVQQSGILSLVKKKKYYKKKVSKTVRRDEAKREQMVKELRRKRKEGY